MPLIKTNINLNRFLKSFFAKKSYIKKLKYKSMLLKNLKQEDFKKLNIKLLNFPRGCALSSRLVMYIVGITFSRSNTFLHVMDSTGKLKFFTSAGHLNHRGRNKKSRFNVFKSMIHVLITKLRFLKGKPIALHLKNVGFSKFWVIKRLKNKFLIRSIKIFNLLPFNGCRIKKVRRKKNKRIRRKRRKRVGKNG